MVALVSNGWDFQDSLNPLRKIMFRRRRDPVRQNQDAKTKYVASVKADAAAEADSETSSS